MNNALAQSNTEQLGFDALLADAETDNAARAFARQTAHLPGTWHVAVPFYQRLIEDHHAAMLAANIDEAIRLRKEAHILARKLNDGAPGIIADDDAPGCRLARETVAICGEMPLWGQLGRFVIEVAEIAIDIEMEGIFGIGATSMPWPGFSAQTVDRERPFISETGYRSFLGIHAEIMPDLTPDVFARMAIEAHIEQVLNGRLLTVSNKWP